MDTVELLLHPVRLRIVHAMSGGRIRTTSELCMQLPDISKATVYRHVSLLADAHVLEVVGEQRVRGAMERQYQLSQTRITIDADMAAAMATGDHRRGFVAAMAGLLAEFSAYLDQDQADPVADLVSYRQAVLWLSRDELVEMVTEMRKVLLSRLSNRQTADRTPHLLGLTLFPMVDHSGRR